MALQRSLGRIAAGPRKQCERTVERQIGPLGKRTRRMLASFSVPTRVERTRKIAEQQCGLQPVDPVGEIDQVRRPALLRRQHVVIVALALL